LSRHHDSRLDTTPCRRTIDRFSATQAIQPATGPAG
jgi:hypothetical protein